MLDLLKPQLPFVGGMIEHSAKRHIDVTFPGCVPRVSGGGSSSAARRQTPDAISQWRMSSIVSADTNIGGIVKFSSG
jgi:hypothetical protein